MRGLQVLFRSVNQKLMRQTTDRRIFGLALQKELFQSRPFFRRRIQHLHRSRFLGGL